MSAHEFAVLAEANDTDQRVLREAFELREALRERGPIIDPADPSVPGDIKVLFEGQWCRWSDLCLQDRKAYMQGGYPY
jgi:hypothetical protein